jgi:predicted house-cleaning noncanonical NTP pyrophosphatase (MazG superfamily)
MAFSYGKLVRDKIPEFITGKGKKPITYILSDEDYRVELLKKLTEEVEEVVTAKDKDEMIAELADVQEVMMAIYDAFDITYEEVTREGMKKRKERGGFKDKIFLEDVEE